MWNFYIVLLQIHSANCLQKIGILDLGLIKLLQNEQGCNFFASQCIYINNWIADRLFAKQLTSEATEWPRPVLPWIDQSVSGRHRFPDVRRRYM